MVKYLYMDWESFASWWRNFFNQIGNWFILHEEGKLNNLTRIIIAVATLVIGILLIKLICWILKKAMHINTKLEVDISAKSFFLTVIRTLLYVILVFGVFGILGISLSGLAGLASAITVALGLALQDLIGAFFAGLVLLRAKHFKTGDFIHVQHANGSCEGKVKRINLFTTSLTTVDNQTVIINNSKLLSSVITNFNDNTTRRLVLTVDVDYDTDIEKCKALLKEVIESDNRILVDPKADIHVDNLSEYSIVMKIKCYTINEDYWPVRNSIYEKILLKFREENIKIPFRRFVVESYDSKNED